MADIYERTPGKWYLRGRIDGKRIHRLAGLSKSEAMAALREFKRSRAVRVKSQLDDPLFRDVCAEYLDSAYIRIAQRTFDGYIRALNAYWNKQFSQLHISEITAIRIDQELNALIRRGVTPRSANQAQRVLRIILGYAKNHGYINDVPRVKALKEYDREFPNIKAEDLRNYLSRAPSDLKDFATIMLYTGLRVTELIDLVWNDIDMKNMQINIRAKLSLKTSHGGMIPFGDVAMRVLSQRRDRIGPFSSISYDSISKAHRKMNVCWRLYDFRHLFCTHLLEAGVDPATVSKLMRHDIKMTMRVYHHLRLDHARDAISRLPDVTLPTPDEH